MTRLSCSAHEGTHRSLRRPRSAVRTSVLVAAAAVAVGAMPASAQVPDAPAVSSVQAAACTFQAPFVGDYCGWGVWTLDADRSVLIAHTDVPATYLVCRENVSDEQLRYPMLVEVDEGVVTADPSGRPLSAAEAACFVVSGRKVVLTGSRAPTVPVHGYYIRVGESSYSNSVRWQIHRDGGVPGGNDRVIVSRFTAPRLVRVCFGAYLPSLNPPGHVRQHWLVVDGAYAVVRGGTRATFPATSCIDVTGSVIGVEPVWPAPGAGVAFGRLVF